MKMGSDRLPTRPMSLRWLPKGLKRKNTKNIHHCQQKRKYCFGSQGVNGNKMEKACDLVHITLNKNAVVGDVSALAPGGVRIGAPAMTSRGLKEAEFETIADLLHEARPLLLCVLCFHASWLCEGCHCLCGPVLQRQLCLTLKGDWVEH